MTYEWLKKECMKKDDDEPQSIKSLQNYMNAKKWYLSKTIQGAVITIITAVVGMFSLQVTDTEITTIIMSLFSLIGVGYSIYGRIVTKGEKIIQ